jgi:hypothetical protein
MNARAETYKHIRRVNELLIDMAHEILCRAAVHDDSKLLPPEAELFEASTEKLSGLTYGSDEYKAQLEALKPAVEHHQQCNRHHPEFHGDGIHGMNLIDLLEMLCDWKAAGERHDNGDIRRSIEVNQARFGYSDELKRILLNTVDGLEPSINESHFVN